MSSRERKAGDVPEEGATPAHARGAGDDGAPSERERETADLLPPPVALTLEEGEDGGPEWPDETETADLLPPPVALTLEEGEDGGPEWPDETETADLLPPPVALTLEEGESDASQTSGEGLHVSLRRRLLAELDRGATPGETADEAAKRRLDALLDAVRVELQGPRPVGAAVAADLAMEERPDTAMVQKRLHENASLLLEAYEQLLGDPAGIPLVALPMHELKTQDLDSRAVFLLSRVDGMLSFDDIVDVSGMPLLEAYSYLARLVLQGIIEVR